MRNIIGVDVPEDTLDAHSPVGMIHKRFANDPHDIARWVKQAGGGCDGAKVWFARIWVSMRTASSNSERSGRKRNVGEYILKVSREPRRVGLGGQRAENRVQHLFGGRFAPVNNRKAVERLGPNVV